MNHPSKLSFIQVIDHTVHHILHLLLLSQEILDLTRPRQNPWNTNLRRKSTASQSRTRGGRRGYREFGGLLSQVLSIFSAFPHSIQFLRRSSSLRSLPCPFHKFVNFIIVVARLIISL